MSEQGIVFGLHLDGQRAVTPTNQLGGSVVGPLGMLNLLETWLGLLAERPSQAERIAQFRDCLARADSDSRFYHASFSVDALGTAATLLGWRDLWHLHGWQGAMPAGCSSKRLVDMAQVELLVPGVLAPSTGERLAAVLAGMGKRRVPIRQVLLVDPLQAFPQRWQAVLAKLPVTSAPEGSKPAAGFLGKLQAGLRRIGNAETPVKIPWKNDGTVTLVRAETSSVAASWMARERQGKESALVVAGADAACLDANLDSAGLARQGFREASQFRPALQVLPLAMELIREPVNFYALVQFLTHPICPVPRYARGMLAEQIADAPGMGGAAWQKAMEKIDGHYAGKQADIRRKIAFWVECQRYAPADGVPLAVAIERVRALADYFRVQLGNEDPARQAAFVAGYSQCNACLRALLVLQGQGMEKISHRQLQHAVAQATASGTDNPLLVAQVGACLSVTHPGAAVEPTDHVFWWQLAVPVLPGPYPWSSAELAALRDAGAQLPENKELLEQAAREWLRPIFAARKHLTLVLPPAGEEVHPLWQMIAAVVDKPVVQALEALLVRGNAATQPVVVTPLPALRRWWKLPQDVPVARRDKESFSSLEMTLFNPYQWLLKYPANLQPSRIVSLGGEFRMLGNLAHRLVEKYFGLPKALAMSDEAFNAWFDPAFRQLVTEEGAFLLMPGRAVDLEGFRYRLRQALLTLRRHLLSAKVAKVTPEMPLLGTFVGGEMYGLADLVLQKKGGKLSILDMKWSGVKKYPDALKSNRQLQLAIYAAMLRADNHGDWPSIGYYVLSVARAFSPDRRGLPDAEVIESTSGEGTAQLWERFNKTWSWRRAQLDAGLIEVALEGIDETDSSTPPADAMGMEYLNESYNEYRALAGWKV